MQKQKLTAAGCSYLVKLCKNANMCNHHSRSVIEKQSKYCILYLSYWYASLYFSVVQLKPTRGKSLLLVVAWIDTSGPNTGSIITPRYNVCSHLLHITVLQWLIQHMAGLPHTHTSPKHTLSHTHTHTSRCQGLLSPRLTQCYLQVGVGFPFFGGGILSEQETASIWWNISYGSC